MISNYMEIVVKDTLSDLLKDQEIKCDCDECIADIQAITLNNLKPMYVVSNKGIVFTKLNQLNNQFKADVYRELAKAMNVVEKNPSY